MMHILKISGGGGVPDTPPPTLPPPPLDLRLSDFVIVMLHVAGR